MQGTTWGALQGIFGKQSGENSIPWSVKIRGFSRSQQKKGGGGSKKEEAAKIKSAWKDPLGRYPLQPTTDPFVKTNAAS